MRFTTKFNVGDVVKLVFDTTEEHPSIPKPMRGKSGTVNMVRAAKTDKDLPPTIDYRVMIEDANYMVPERFVEKADG